MALAGSIRANLAAMFSPTVIPAHTAVTGRVQTPGDVVLEGRVEGDIKSEGCVTVQTNGACVASIEARAAQIYGEVIGNIVCTESVHVAASARVVGDIQAPNVEVHGSATVDGRVDLLPPDPRAPTIQRLPLRPRGRVARPAVPSVEAASPVPPLAEADSDFDDIETHDARGLEATTERRTVEEETAPTAPEKLGARRPVPKPKRPRGRVRMSSRKTQ